MIKRDSTERIIDNLFLESFKNEPFKNVIKELLKGYKRIFFVVYDAFGMRYQKLYTSKYLSSFFDGIFFLSLYRGFIDLIKESIERQAKDFNESNLNLTTIEKEKLKVNIIYLVNDENNNEPGNKSRNEIEICIDAMEIFNEIRFKIFDQAESWLTVAEYDKIVLQPTKKDQDKKMLSLAYYIQNNRDRFSIKYINQLSSITDDFKPLYSLLNADRKKDFYKSFKQPFKDSLIKQSGEFESANSDQPERKSLENLFKRFNDYLTGKIEFEKRMINQLKQLTNL